jgi:cyclic pyranopterin phosphate synthase
VTFPTKRRARPTVLSHLDAQGRARMVDVGAKPETERVAVARGEIRMRPETLRLIAERRAAKGDVLAIAEIAGIQAAKRASEIVPLCHPLALTSVAVRLDLRDDVPAVEVEATVRTVGRTGVEMEALTAVCGAALCVYDMVKAVDRDMTIGDVRLERKSGGRSGSYVRGAQRTPR